MDYKGENDKMKSDNNSFIVFGSTFGFGFSFSGKKRFATLMCAMLLTYFSAFRFECMILSNLANFFSIV